MQTLLESTTLDDCNWIEIVKAIFGDWLLVWSESYMGYQGDARALLTKAGEFAVVEWTWGSCDHCDPYMNLSESEARAEFEKDAMRFRDLATLRAWFAMLDSTGKASHVAGMVAAVDAMAASDPSPA